MTNQTNQPNRNDWKHYTKEAVFERDTLREKMEEHARNNIEWHLKPVHRKNRDAVRLARLWYVEDGVTFYDINARLDALLQEALEMERRN